MTEILSLLNDSDDDELYALLGAELLGVGFGAGAMDDDQNRRFGMQWFEDRIESFRDTVCATEVMAALTGEFNTDAAAIAGVLPIQDNKILALTVAAIILRRGLAAFCRNRLPA
ncbi:hypothetical protein [Nocardia thailandica]|uniref:hypothetical protein n=1 Tax=Nocardia thailandica TaxID=257275 RepID=UPI00031EB3D0|nr:hypothetical protein [Nocardia thailandica]